MLCPPACSVSLASFCSYTLDLCNFFLLGVQIGNQDRTRVLCFTCGGEEYLHHLSQTQLSLEGTGYGISYEILRVKVEVG